MTPALQIRRRGCRDDRSSLLAQSATWSRSDRSSLTTLVEPAPRAALPPARPWPCRAPTAPPRRHVYQPAGRFQADPAVRAGHDERAPCLPPSCRGSRPIPLQRTADRATLLDRVTGVLVAGDRSSALGAVAVRRVPRRPKPTGGCAGRTWSALFSRRCSVGSSARLGVAASWTTAARGNGRDRRGLTRRASGRGGGGKAMFVGGCRSRAARRERDAAQRGARRGQRACGRAR